MLIELGPSPTTTTTHLPYTVVDNPRILPFDLPLDGVVPDPFRIEKRLSTPPTMIVAGSQVSLSPSFCFPFLFRLAKRPDSGFSRLSPLDAWTTSIHLVSGGLESFRAHGPRCNIKPPEARPGRPVTTCKGSAFDDRRWAYVRENADGAEVSMKRWQQGRKDDWRNW